MDYSGWLISDLPPKERAFYLRNLELLEAHDPKLAKQALVPKSGNEEAMKQIAREILANLLKLANNPDTF